MVLMAWLHVQGACVGALETENVRWVGNDRCGGDTYGTLVCPLAPTITRKLEYIYAFVQDMAHVEVQKGSETPNAFRIRVYDTMYVMSRAGREQQETRVVRQNPATDWKYVWTNLQDSGTTETITAVWHAIIHDILPTNIRFHNIRLADTPSCKECGGLDTHVHLLIECGEGMNIWEWTRQRIACIMRASPERIPEEWLLRLQFQIWPPRRNRAVPWILAHMVWFRMQERLPSAQDYCDFMRRPIWKVEQQAARREKFGNYLVVL
jgi:hypothetical protein